MRPKASLKTKIRDNLTILLPKDKFPFLKQLDLVEVKIRKTSEEDYSLMFESYILDSNEGFIVPIPKSIYVYFLANLGINIGDEIEVSVCLLRRTL